MNVPLQQLKMQYPITLQLVINVVALHKLFMLQALTFQSSYKDVSKSSRTVLVKRSLLTLDVKFLHHLQSTPLLHEYSGPNISAMLGSIPGSPF